MKGIIIDDEPMVREDLHHLLAAHPDIRIIGEAGSVPEAKIILTGLQADVVFLDIQLIGGTGFDLVPLIPPATRIIFFTSYDEYAVRAFEVNALDYLLKPVSADRLADSLARLRGANTKHQPQHQPEEHFHGDDRIFIRADREQFFVAVQDILAVTSIGGNYCVVHLRDGSEYTVRKTMKQWEQGLPADLFLRIHRSTIISLNSIKSIQKTKKGGYLAVIFGTGHSFAVSRRAADRLKKIITK